MEMNVLVQRRAEAVDDGHWPNAGRCTATGTVFAQATFHHAQQYAQDGLGHCAIRTAGLVRLG
jgi:hypothetical protein